MSKILKNNTQSDIVLLDVGQTVPGSGQLTIDQAAYIDYSISNNVITYIGSGDLTVNDGTNDLSISDGINLIKGIYPAEVKDTDNRTTVRIAAAAAGWTYLAHPIEFTTSKLNSCYSNDWQDSGRGNVTMKFYNSSGTELTAGTQIELTTNCVETRITLSPNYDYEIISGNIHQHTSPAVDVRLWVVGGVIDTTTYTPWEYPASSGIYHVSEFAGGLNMKYMGAEEQIQTDGRASKYMKKTTANVPYNSNQLQFIVRHPVGHQHDLMVIVEYFRA